MIREQSKRQHVATPVHPLLRLQQSIGNRAVARLIRVKLQKKQAGSEYGEQPHKPTSQPQKGTKAELEFYSALHFNSTFSGFNPTPEPEEGGYGILWWSVWNTGWTRAPEHTNRLTIYNAALCSGCRKQEDEISRHEIPGPSIVSGVEQGKSEYENAVVVGPFAAGRYEAFVELDVQNQVDEINENNNTAFLNFNIKPGKDSESAFEGPVQRKGNASTMLFQFRPCAVI
jgi:CARDB